MAQHKDALIFSGGGADGAYEIGVARALFNGKSPSTHGKALDPEIFTGTSIGSFNASFLVSQWEEYGGAAVSNLERTWRERLARRGGGFRIRFDPLDYLDPRSYYPNPFRPAMFFMEDSLELGKESVDRAVHLLTGAEPIVQKALEIPNLASFVSPVPWEGVIRESIDFRKIRESKKKLFIAATNWTQGELRIFSNHEMTDKLGPAAVRASSSVPGLYPIATVGSQKYVDGAILMNTPLKPAIRAGADVLHVIYMNTDVKRMPVDSLRSTLDTLFRTQTIAWAETVNGDIKRAKAYNEGMEMLADPGSLTMKSDAKEDIERKMKGFFGAAGVIARAAETGKKYHPITIHRYFPPDGLSGALGFLDLRPKRIQRLIDEGFDHTVAHDCVANGCIIPECHKEGEEG